MDTAAAQEASSGLASLCVTCIAKEPKDSTQRTSLAAARFQQITTDLKNTAAAESAEHCRRLGVMVRTGLVAGVELDSVAPAVIEAVLATMSRHLEAAEVQRHAISFLHSYATAHVQSSMRKHDAYLHLPTADANARPLLQHREVVWYMTLGMGTGGKRDNKPMHVWGDVDDPTEADAGHRRLLGSSAAIQATVYAMGLHSSNLLVVFECVALFQAIAWGSDPLCLMGLVSNFVPKAVVEAATRWSNAQLWHELLFYSLSVWTLNHLVLGDLQCKRAVSEAGGSHIFKNLPFTAVIGRTSIYISTQSIIFAMAVLDEAQKPDATTVSCLAAANLEQRVYNVAFSYAIDRNEHEEQQRQEAGIVEPARGHPLEIRASDLFGPTEGEWVQARIDVEEWEREETATVISHKRCATCGEFARPNQRLKKCDSCRQLHFCNEDCQRLGWKRGHKRFCGEPCPTFESIKDGTPAHVLSALKLPARWHSELALACLRRLQCTELDVPALIEHRVFAAILVVLQVHNDVWVQAEGLKLLSSLIGSHTKEGAEADLVKPLLTALAHVCAASITELPMEAKVDAGKKGLLGLQMLVSHSDTLRECAVVMAAAELAMILCWLGDGSLERSACTFLEFLIAATDEPDREHVRRRASLSMLGAGLLAIDGRAAGRGYLPERVKAALRPGSRLQTLSFVWTSVLAAGGAVLRVRSM